MNRLVNRLAVPALIGVVILLSGCGSVVKTGSTGANIYRGLDGHHREIRTDSADAQLWFDQGLQWCYGFNHAEAIRSFKQAAVEDPSAPMPWWGIAYANGMNINDPVMNDDRWQAATEAAQQAMQRLDGADPAEAALVRAVATRYSWPAPADQRTLDEAYADAMGEVHAAFPHDADVAALYAESLMNLQPWDYWTNDGEPKGRIEEVVATLEGAMATNPDHPGANHLYIHAMEAAKPDAAVPAAERLSDEIPGSGHLVHMPSHIFIRVGRYADAADSNVRAVAADRAYFANAPTDQGIYWIYFAHNLHFLAFASMMEGRYDTALRAARELEESIPEAPLRAFAPLIEGIMPTTFHVMVRFGKWEDILEEPARPDYRLVTNAVRHYARGIAYSALGETQAAHAEVLAFEEAAAAIPDDWMVFNNRIDKVLPIARGMLAGELAFREGRLDMAFTALRRAVEAEDALVYDEPPAWMLPVRHALGALLMSAGRYAEAEQVYRKDLTKNRNNGWALLGLQLALEAQGQNEELPMLAARRADAFRRCDVNPTSSCFCEPGAAN